MKKVEISRFLVKESPLCEESFQNRASQGCVRDRGLVMRIKIGRIFSQTRDGVVISPPQIILNKSKS